MNTAPYVLPNGTIVDIHDDVARGAATVSFTMKGGAIVNAKRLTFAEAIERFGFKVADEMMPDRPARGSRGPV